MAFALKINFDSDIRRKRFNNVKEVTTEQINSFVFENFGLTDYVAKYRDDEGDLCTLSAVTLEDALDLAASGGILLLMVSPSQEVTAAEECSQASTIEEPSDAARNVESSKADGEAQRCPGLSWHGGGPKWLAFAFKMMNDSGCLRADLATALVTQWLPIVKQRAVRKMEKIRVVGPDFVPKVASAIVALSESVDCSDKLKPFQQRLCGLVSNPGAEDIGMLVVDFLKVMMCEPFHVQCQVLQPVVAELLTLPCVQESFENRESRWHKWAAPSSTPLLHQGVVCDVCHATPIEGPRFKCTTCDDYDLCGACYLKKNTFHSEEHTFETILLPGKGSKGGRKGSCGEGRGHWGKSRRGEWDQSEGFNTKPAKPFKAGHPFNEEAWGNGAGCGWGWGWGKPDFMNKGSGMMNQGAFTKGWGKPDCFMNKGAFMKGKFDQGTWGKGHGKAWSKGCGKGNEWWNDASWAGKGCDWTMPWQHGALGHDCWTPWYGQAAWEASAAAPEDATSSGSCAVPEEIHSSLQEGTPDHTDDYAPDKDNMQYW